jgi:hypothetical protein
MARHAQQVGHDGRGVLGGVIMAVRIILTGATLDT